MKRGEQWNAVEGEDKEPLGWHCDDCIADWKAGREIGTSTAAQSAKDTGLEPIRHATS
jgi:hypothetical protein